MKSTIHLTGERAPTVAPDAPPLHVPTASGGYVNASCVDTITIDCLLQLYNAVGYKASKHTKNRIGVTGFLEEYANLQDLQAFYRDQRPDAVNSSFALVSVNGESMSTILFSSIIDIISGGWNDQDEFEAGREANLGKRQESETHGFNS